MKAADVLTGVAAALDGLAAGLTEPVEKAATLGAAEVLRGLIQLLAHHTPAECIAILEKIRDHGTTGISASELDAQTAAAIARAKGG